MTDNQEVKTWPRASLEQVVMDEMNSIDDQRVKHFKLIFKYQETLALQNKEEGKLLWMWWSRNWGVVFWRDTNLR